MVLHQPAALVKRDGAPRETAVVPKAPTADFNLSHVKIQTFFLGQVKFDQPWQNELTFPCSGFSGSQASFFVPKDPSIKHLFNGDKLSIFAIMQEPIPVFWNTCLDHATHHRCSLLLLLGACWIALICSTVNLVLN